MENAPENNKIIKMWDGPIFSDTLYDRPSKPAVADRDVDHKGRFVPSHMTDRELLEEIVTTLRTTQDAMEGIVASASKNPMFKMLGIKGL